MIAFALDAVTRSTCDASMSIGYANALEIASARDHAPRALHALAERLERVGSPVAGLVADEEHPLDRRVARRAPPRRARGRAAGPAVRLEDDVVDVVLPRLVDDARPEEAVVADQALAERLEREQAGLVRAGAGGGQDGREVRVTIGDADELLQVALGLGEHRRERVLPVVVAGRVREVLRDERRDADRSRSEQDWFGSLHRYLRRTRRVPHPRARKSGSIR